MLVLRGLAFFRNSLISTIACLHAINEGKTRYKES
jgi:hypothetical protein